MFGCHEHQAKAWIDIQKGVQGTVYGKGATKSISSKDFNLDSCLMFTPAVNGLAVAADAALLQTRPYIHQVVIAPAGQVSPIKGPLQPTYPLGVTSEHAEVMVCQPHVRMVDVPCFSATRERNFKV